jgi:long-chain acyl-CoA synthetase
MFAAQADGGWQPVTAAQFAGRVGAVAADLIASEIRPGDRVGLMAPTSLEWAMCDFAIWAAGAVTVPIYETSSAEQIDWALSDSGAVAVFAGTARLAEAIHGARPAKVEAIWRLDDGGLDALALAGQGVEAGEVTRRRAAVTAETLATIVYTSGMTGRSKGCMISHGTLAQAVRAITAVPGVQEQILTRDASSLFFLSLSHVLARALMLCLVHAGKRSGFLPDPGQLPGALATFRPTILLTVPRVLEKIAAAARQQAEAEGHQRLFAAAEATAIAWSRAGQRAGPWLRMRHALFGRPVYARLRQAWAGRWPG